MLHRAKPALRKHGIFECGEEDSVANEHHFSTKRCFCCFPPPAQAQQRRNNAFQFLFRQLKNKIKVIFSNTKCGVPRSEQRGGSVLDAE